MNNTDFDVVIVGGGPAGTSAALFLNKYGINCAIIEKKIFPREVLCGEFISKEVILLLKELNILENFLSLSPNKITEFRFATEKKVVQIPLGFNAYAIKRGQFDNLLLNECKKNNITIFQPEEVKSIDFNNNSFNTLTSKRKLSSKFVIAAYGKHNILDRTLNRNFVNNKSGLNGIKFHFPKKYLKNYSENTISIFANNTLYCGINSVDDDTVTVCFLENRKNVNIPPKEHLKKLYNKNKYFSQNFMKDFNEVIENLPVYGTGNIYFGKKELIKNNILMCGDAASVIAPLAGDGIGIAFQNGKLIAEVLDKYFNSNVPRNEIEKIYINEWNLLYKKRIKIALLIQKKIFSSFFYKTFINYLPFEKTIMKYLIKNTRG